MPTKAAEVSTSPTPVVPEIVVEGVLKLDIKPWGAIAVDGVTRGLSPPLKQLTLPVGSHTVEISNPPAALVKRTIDVVKDTPVTISHTFK